MAEKRKWSKNVTEHSDALDLKQGVFKLKDPQRIAASLKQSAEHSERRKSDPYRSAMSMLTFYINRAGDHLPAAQHKRLEQAKDALRELYDRPPRAHAGEKKKSASGKPKARSEPRSAGKRSTAPSAASSATRRGTREKRSS